MRDLEAEWESLCEEYRAAQKRELELLTSISGQMSAVANGGGANPSMVELSEWIKAGDAVQAVRAKMDEVLEALWQRR